MSLQILYVWILDCQMDKLLLFEVINNVRVSWSSFTCSPKTKDTQFTILYVSLYKTENSTQSLFLLEEISETVDYQNNCDITFLLIN